jgi:hypothetical protein
MAAIAKEEMSLYEYFLNALLDLDETWHMVLLFTSIF